jgi:hypothetical protein
MTVQLTGIFRISTCKIKNKYINKKKMEIEEYFPEK